MKLLKVRRISIIGAIVISAHANISLTFRGHSEKSRSTFIYTLE